MKNISSIFAATLPAHWWNKSKNLERLQSINSTNFFVPEFICLDLQQFEHIDDIVTSFLSVNNNQNKRFAVRSDSTFEDSEEHSGAWTFETVLNVPWNLYAIKCAIQKIHEDSLSKVKTKIPIILQEMVEEPDVAWTIFWLDVRNDNPNYYTLDCTNWLWDKVVEGTHNTDTFIIRKSVNELNSQEHSFISDLLVSIKEVESLYQSQLLDFEFCIKDWKVYLLQVRPLTALQNISCIQSDHMKRLITYINDKLADTIHWNMIDINPAELLWWHWYRVINWLFNTIFPKESLWKARTDLGYWSSEWNMFTTFFDKPFINLERDLANFLPNTLSSDEVSHFLNYYSDLLNTNPTLQDKLDSIEYPININKTQEIIDTFLILDSQKTILLEKFNTFFISLEKSLSEKCTTYFSLEKELCTKIFPESSWQIENITKSLYLKWDIDQLVEQIKELTYHFSSFARWAFYFTSQDFTTYPEQLYANKLTHSQHSVVLPDWFNIFSRKEIQFNKESTIWPEALRNEKTIFETARENLKFMFMVLLWRLGELIEQSVWEEFDTKELAHADFDFLLKTIKDKNFSLLKSHIKRRLRNNQQFSSIQSPSVINKHNNYDLFKLLHNGSFFSFGHENIKGEPIFIENLMELSDTDLISQINWKVLLLHSATPEIDNRISIIWTYAKGIVTKYWGPWAHIVLKIREFNQWREHKIPLVAWVWDKFDNLKKQPTVEINFITTSIS